MQIVRHIGNAPPPPPRSVGTEFCCVCWWKAACLVQLRARFVRWLDWHPHRQSRGVCSGCAAVNTALMGSWTLLCSSGLQRRRAPLAPRCKSCRPGTSFEVSRPLSALLHPPTSKPPLPMPRVLRKAGQLVLGTFRECTSCWGVGCASHCPCECSALLCGLILAFHMGRPSQKTEAIESMTAPG